MSASRSCTSRPATIRHHMTPVISAVTVMATDLWAPSNTPRPVRSTYLVGYPTPELGPVGLLAMR